MPARRLTPSRNTWKLFDWFRPTSMRGAMLRAQSHFALPTVGYPALLSGADPPG